MDTAANELCFYKVKADKKNRLCFERPIVNLKIFLGIRTFYDWVGIKAIGKKK